MNGSSDPAITDMDLSRLVEEHYPSVLRRLRALVGDRHAAEDLAQEVFARLFVAMRSGRRIENRTAYLNGVIHHVFCQYLREKKARPRMSLVQDVASEARGAFRTDRPVHEAILELVSRLPHRQQAVIVGRFLLHMSVHEIARSLGSSQRSISVWQAKAMNTLRQLAVEQGIDLEQTT